MITITGFALSDCSSWSSEVWQWRKVRFRRIDKSEEYFSSKGCKNPSNYISESTNGVPGIQDWCFLTLPGEMTWIRLFLACFSFNIFLITYHKDIICSFLKQLRVYKIAWKLLKTRFPEGGEFRWLIMVVINLLIIVITAPSRICLPRWT